MPNSNNIIPTIGILGGGQLGRMLIQEGLNWNLHISVLDPDDQCPCAGIASSFQKGSFKDYQTVLEFGRKVDILTIEIEQVNIEALYVLEKEGVKIYPQPNILEMIKDKGLQKKFYKENNIPSSDFCLIDSKEELGDLDDSWFPCFQKARKDGYDGRGVQLLKSKSDLSLAFDVPSVIEKRVEMLTEFAIIGAGDGNGNCTVFPPVDMEFHSEANLVEFLRMPAEIDSNHIRFAEQIVNSIFQNTKLQGILAVEFFLNKEGDVLVNEMAPRPHNSGHTTIEGNYCSQFEQHLRAILGWSQGSTNTIKPAVMINLLGEEGFEGPAHYQGLSEILAYEGVFVHLYGKALTKPFRKMGHITVLGDTLEKARDLAIQIKSKIKVISK
ncbi:MAG: 5-(carboxyamino)imidazole ribonucleotide synthase [Bacteroidia bacterium]